MASDDDEDDISDLRNRTRTNDQLSGDEAESTAIKNKAKKENSTPKAISKRGDLGVGELKLFSSMSSLLIPIA